MSTCDRCGGLLEATNHSHVNDPDRATIETQTCTECGFTKQVEL
jgi:hypothetical protein